MVSSIDQSESNNEYEVEAIRASRACKHKGSNKEPHDYLIKWKGYESDENTWECSVSIDAPELLEEFWERQRKVDHGYRTRKKRQLATRPSDVPEEQPVKRKTKKIKQPRVVIASPYSSDDDTITQKGNLEIITTPLQQKYTCAPATSLSLSPKGSNQRLPLWGWTLPAAKATISETPVPSASKPTPTPIAALAAATSPSEKLQPCYNTNVNTLNNDCSSHKDYLRWYPDPASTANTKFNEVAPETLASVNRATLPYPVHNRQTILSTDKLSLRRNEKDGTPIIVFNNLDLQVHNHFRDDWNWEEQISHIVKLLMKKHEGVPTFYYVVRWKDGQLSAHNSTTIRSRCPLKALDFHEKQIAEKS